MKFHIVGRAENLMRRAPFDAVDQLRTATQPRPQHGMTQIGLGLVAAGKDSSADFSSLPMRGG